MAVLRLGISVTAIRQFSLNLSSWLPICQLAGPASEGRDATFLDSISDSMKS